MAEKVAKVGIGGSSDNAPRLCFCAVRLLKVCGGAEMNKHKIAGLLAAIFLGGVFCACAEESITITTYYPSPQGVYKTLKAKRMAIGDSYYSLKWTDEGGIINNTTNVDLVVEGRVGIGSNDPYESLLFVPGVVMMGGGSAVPQSNPSETLLRIRSVGSYFDDNNDGVTDTDKDALILEKTDDNADPIEGGIVLGFAPSPVDNTWIRQPGWATLHVPVLTLRGTGKVGIGTIDPDNKLDISTNTTHDGFKLTDGTHWVKLVSGTATNGAWNSLVSAGDNALIYSASSTAPGSASSAFVIAPWATATSGVRVSNEGKVSIGTKNVYASLLNVGGGIRAMKGPPSGLDVSNVGYTFQADGDSGMFAEGGDDSQNSDIVIRIDNNPSVSFLEGSTKILVHGDAAKTVNSCWAIWSDRRLKKNIGDIHDALGKLLQLKGQEFEWSYPENARIAPGVQMGFIAQDVEKVFPDWVKEDKDGIKTVALKGLEALSVESFRQIDARLSALEKENEELKKKIKLLSGKVQ